MNIKLKSDLFDLSLKAVISEGSTIFSGKIALSTSAYGAEESI